MLPSRSVANLDAVFVGAEYEENLSSRTMAAVARQQGLEARILGFSRDRELPAVLARLVQMNPALVGLSMAFQHRAPEFLALARSLRNERYQGHICAGGHFATAAATQLLRHNPAVDTVIRHDGEIPLGMLLERLYEPDRWGQVPSLCYRQGGGIRENPPEKVPRDLDLFPWPVRDTPLPRHMGVPFTTLCASRGCYGNCTFCAINSYHRSRPGPRLRFRSAHNVAREMAMLYHDKGARIFCFHDDTWFLPNPGRMRARMDELADHLERLDVRLPFAVVAKVRPDAITPELLVHLKKRLGLMRLYVGVENFSEAGIEHLGRRVTREQIDTALTACGEADVYGCYNLLLFEPDARLEDINDNLDGMRRFSHIPVNFCRAEAYNGTALHTYLSRTGRLRGNYLASDYVIADERMEMLFRIVYQAFKDRNFSADALANLNMSLGYELQIIRHFCGPDPVKGGDELENEVRQLIRQINMDSVERLEEAVAFVRQGNHEDASATVSFTVELAGKVNFRGAELHTRLLQIRNRLAEMGRTLPPEATPRVEGEETSGDKAAMQGS